MRFAELTQLSKGLMQVTSRNKMIEMVSHFLSSCQTREVQRSVLLLTGRVSPPGDERRLNVSWSTLWSVLKDMTNAQEDEMRKATRGAVDTGEAVRRVMERLKLRRQSRLFSSPLTVEEVYTCYDEMASATGKGSRERKERLLRSLLSAATPEEAEMIARNLIGEMRLGFHEGLMEEAIAKAFLVPVELVRRAVMLSGDLSFVAMEAKRGSKEALDAVGIEVFRPLKPMLAENADGAEQVLSELGRAAFEYKLDGVRLQIHSRGGRVRAFSRRMTEITSSIPDVVQQFGSIFGARESVADGEAIAVGEQNRPLPFQFVSKRLRRKKFLKEYAELIPLKLYLFDLLYLDGKMLVDSPYSERRAALEGIVDEEHLMRRVITGDAEEVQELMDEALREGHEGLMAKKLSSPYTPGVRGKNWFKIKPILATLDLVIVAAERGYGRRHGWLSDYYLASRDEETGELLVVGKTFKGLTDEEFQEMTKRLMDTAISDEGHLVRVRPSVVVEVAFNEVQKSPKYKSGLALRFARIKSIREDKGPEEADSIQRIREIYRKQFEAKARPSQP